MVRHMLDDMVADDDVVAGIRARDILHVDRIGAVENAQLEVLKPGAPDGRVAAELQTARALEVLPAQMKPDLSRRAVAWQRPASDARLQPSRKAQRTGDRPGPEARRAANDARRERSLAVRHAFTVGPRAGAQPGTAPQRDKAARPFRRLAKPPAEYPRKLHGRCVMTCVHTRALSFRLPRRRRQLLLRVTTQARSDVPVAGSVAVTATTWQPGNSSRNTSSTSRPKWR